MKVGIVERELRLVVFECRRKRWLVRAPRREAMVRLAAKRDTAQRRTSVLAGAMTRGRELARARRE